MTMVKRIALTLLALILFTACVSVAYAVPEPFYTFKTTAKLNCRADSDIDSAILHEFDKNEYVKVYGFEVSYPDERIWAETYFINRFGTRELCYVSFNFIKCVEDPYFPKLTAYMQVNRDYVHIHASDNSDSIVIGTAYAGDVFSVDYFYPSFDGNLWARCYDNAEFVGYINVEYLNADNLSYDEIEFNEPIDMMITGNSVNMREGPSTAHKVINVLHHKDIVTAKAAVEISQDTTWIKCTDGKHTGYVSQKYLVECN